MAEAAYQQLEAQPLHTTWHALKGRVAARVPILSWLSTYEGKYLMVDLTAGVSLGTMCLAQTLAHATIATTDPIQGPYCALVPPFIYAVLGTSKHGSVSSGAMAAMILANVLQPFPDQQDRTELASLLALLSGFFQVLMGVFDLASAVRFLSQPTLSGFVTGGAVLIIVSQLKGFFGYTQFPHAGGPFQKVLACIQQIHQANWVNVGLCSCLILIIVSCKRLKATAKREQKQSLIWRMAGRVAQIKEILVVVFGILFVRLTKQEDGSTLVPSVGYIPEGLPPLRLPWQLNATEKLLNGPADVLHGFVLSGAIVAFSTFLTSYSSFKKQALACDYNLDARQELYALGAAGILGSFFGAFPPSGSLSRTGLAVQLGVHSQICSIFTALTVAAGLICLAPALEDLPKASLAAIVMVSAEGLMDFKMPLQLWGSTPKTFRSSFRKDLIVWFVGFLCTILAGALYGIMLSVLVALAQVVAEAATPQAVTLGEVPRLKQWHDVDRWAEAETLPGILVFEFRGPLVFASAEWFEEEVERRRLQAKSKVNFVILCMGAVATIDYSALEILRGILLEWRRKGLHCLVADANSTVLELLREQLGHELLQQFQTKPAGQTAEVHFEIQEVLSIEDAVIVASQKLKCLQADSKRMADPV
ncbi:unnamed protein product [Durusdinium trenchii]|uniref:STAS domain-containing protein n=1 Tax=Durusdinium trenchii TaxID=1381693 RepID=A0ABP0MYU2_9DINO